MVPSSALAARVRPSGLNAAVRGTESMFIGLPTGLNVPVSHSCTEEHEHPTARKASVAAERRWRSPQPAPFIGLPTGAPVLEFQSWTVPSTLPVATVRPSALNLIVPTGCSGRIGAPSRPHGGGVVHLHDAGFEKGRDPAHCPVRNEIPVRVGREAQWLADGIAGAIPHPHGVDRPI